MIDKTSHAHLVCPCTVNVDFKEILFHLDQHRSMQHYTAAMLLQRKNKGHCYVQSIFVQAHFIYTEKIMNYNT